MINHHVVSLELSTKIKELGVPQTALFDWVQQGETIGVFSHTLHPIGTGVDYCSAFLAFELGEMLPVGGGFYVRKQRGGRWLAQYELPSVNRNSESMVGAIGALLVHLIESGIVDPKQLSTKG